MDIEDYIESLEAEIEIESLLEEICEIVVCLKSLSEYEGWEFFNWN